MITVIPDISLVYQMINFLILLFVLNQVLYKPIRKVILDRRQKVEILKDNADQASNDLFSQEQSYKNRLKQAKDEGLQEKSIFLEKALQEEKEIIEKINKKAQSNLTQVKEQIAREREQARKTLEDEVDIFASAISEKILGRAC